MTEILGPAVVGGALLFYGYDYSAGLGGLWRSDGTAAGTGLVKDIYPGPLHYIDQIVAVGDRAVFASSDGLTGLEVWRSDGTAAGTEVLADVVPSPAGSDPGGFTVSGGNLFLRAYDDSAGSELWAIPLWAVTWPCGAAPILGCAGPVVAQGKGKLSLKDNAVNDKRDFLKWDFRDGPLAALGDFGDLVGGGMRLRFACTTTRAARPSASWSWRSRAGARAGPRPAGRRRPPAIWSSPTPLGRRAASRRSSSSRALRGDAAQPQGRRDRARAAYPAVCQGPQGDRAAPEHEGVLLGGALQHGDEERDGQVPGEGGLSPRRSCRSRHRLGGY